MRKRITALLLAGALALGLLPAPILAAPAGDTVQTISTAAEFAAMDPAGCYRLAEDVTITAPFPAVFAGSLDGGGHTVTLELTAQADTVSLALFPETDGASIQALTITGTVSAGEDSGLAYAAALAGSTSGDTEITACKTTARLDIAVPGASVGGLTAAQLDGTLTLTGCAAAGEISAPQAAFTGGLVGRQESYSALTMQNCYQTANITGGAEDGLCTGGLIGSVGGDAVLRGCWSAASPEDHAAALTAWGAPYTVSGGLTGALCGAVDGGASLTGAHCFWIAAPVGSDGAFHLPDSGLFPEYGPDRREALLAALNTDAVPEGCAYLLPPDTGWPLLRWEQPLTEEERLAEARQTAAAEVETAFAAALDRVQQLLAAVTSRTGLWYELYDAARQTASDAAARLAQQRAEALSALTAGTDINEIQRLAAESRTAMEQTAAGMENAIGGNGVSMDKRWDGVTQTRPTGTGTAADPFLITSGAELAWFAARVNGGSTAISGVLTAEIDLNGFDWTPIGSSAKKFSGSFDGAGYAIKNLTINYQTAKSGERLYLGLFGYAEGTKDNRAAIKNLTVQGSVNAGSEFSVYSGNVAGVVACGSYVDVSGVISRVNVTVDAKVGSACGVGGLAGVLINSTATNCGSGGNVSGVKNLGGLCYEFYAGTMTGCYNTGAVSGSGTCVGGIMGYAKQAAIKDVYNTGAVSTTKNLVGGLVGEMEKSSLTNGYSTGKITVSESGGSSVGAAVGWADTLSNVYYLEGTSEKGVGRDGTAAAKTADELKAKAMPAALGNGFKRDLGNINGGYPVLSWQTSDCKHTGGTEIKDAKDATCTENGYTGDIYCKSCGAKLESGKVIPAAGHKGGTATCKDKAVCEVCQQPYGELNKNNHTGGTEVKDAKDATCTENGYTGDTYCKGCGDKLESGKVIPAAGHKGGTATCKDKALCEVCRQPYGELDKGNHADLKKVDAKKATYTKEGNITYWYCDGCGKYYSDAEATKEITKADTVIPRKTHSSNSGSTGSGADVKKGVQSSKTGDAGVALYAAMSLLSLTGGAVVLGRKRKAD